MDLHLHLQKPATTTIKMSDIYTPVQLNLKNETKQRKMHQKGGYSDNSSDTQAQ